MPGNNFGQFVTACPFGQAISGSCGHRDFNSAMQDISIYYSGLYEANTTAWRCLLKNGNGSARAIQLGVLCTSAPVNHSFPDAAEPAWIADTVIPDAGNERAR